MNPFKLRRWLASVLMGTIPTLCFAFGIFYYNIWIAVTSFSVSLLVMTIIGGVILKNPFTMMLEGKGLLCFDLNSTGIIRPFILSLNLPFVKGIIKGRKITDVWDRNSTFALTNPVKVKEVVKKKDGELQFKITEEQYNSSKFSFINYPLLIYNNNLKSLITKEWLSEKENKSFIHHHLLFTNRMLEELNINVRDFGRYVVESLKPVSGIFKSTWFWVIVVIGLVVLAVLFGKPLADVLINSFNPSVEAIGTVTENQDLVNVRG